MTENIIRVTKGTDFTLNLNFFESAGSIFDLTACTVKFLIRRNPTAAPVITKTVTSFALPASGQAQIVLQDSDTDLDIRAWQGQIIMVDSAGDDHPSVYFTFLVTNPGMTTQEIAIDLYSRTFTSSTGVRQRRWVDANGVVWIETIDTDGAVTTVQAGDTDDDPTFDGLLLALQS